jgi:hypothetical protein
VNLRTTPAIDCAQLVSSIAGVEVRYINGPNVIVFGPTEKLQEVKEMFLAHPEYQGHVYLYFIGPDQPYSWNLSPVGGDWELILLDGMVLPIK